jgi:hypothetical protein
VILKYPTIKAAFRCEEGAMKSRIICCKILLLVVFISLQGFAGDNGTWKMIKDARGVKVYSRPYPGSDYKELYADGYEVVPFEVGVEFVKDCDAYHEWYGMCKELYVIKKYSEREYDMYFVLDVPVVTDRDLVVKVKSWWDIEKGDGWVTIDSMKSDYKKDSGCVRMPEMHGKFTFKRYENDKIYVKYWLHAEMGGSLPAWVVNIAATNHPFLTAVGAKRNVHKKQYFEQAGRIHGKQFVQAE